MKTKYLQNFLIVFTVFAVLCCIGLYQLTPKKENYILRTNCTMANCFLNSKCTFASKFKAFVYPNQSGEKPFKNLLYGKEYFTDDPYQACVFLYFFDNDIRNFPKLKYWGKNGENHIIINLHNHNMEFFNTGFALLVQSIFPSQNFRPGLDFLSPLYNETFSHRIWELLTPIFPLKRKWLLSYMESYETPSKDANVYQDIKEKLCRVMKIWNKNAPKLTGKIYFRCSAGLSNWRPQPKEDQHRIFVGSIFTIIQVPLDAEASLTFQHLLLNALYSGAIPVLIGTSSKKETYLPLQEYVSWDKIVVWFPASNIKDISSLITTLSEADIYQMKRDARYAIEILLSNKGSILACILETIIKRLRLPAIGFQQMPSRKLFIRYPKDFKEKDYLQPNAYNYGQQFLEKMTIPSKALSFIDPHLGVGRSWPKEKFTVLIVTYHRENILKQILSQYKNLPFLDRIVLVWNAQDNNVNKSVIPDIGVPIHVISNGKNSLNNRFLPLEVIRTQAIFTVDDDITLENGDILLAFRVWRENRDRIVGFPARYHEWNPKSKRWFYSSGYKMGQSLILTGATFLHKHYFFLYSYVMNPAIRELVYKKMNCEDLAMNMLVAHVSKKSPMKTIRKQFFANKFKLKDGLSFKPKHKDKRDGCLNEFAQIYGYMPLIFTQYEADYLIGKQQYNNKFYRVT